MFRHVARTYMFFQSVHVKVRAPREATPTCSFLLDKTNAHPPIRIVPRYSRLPDKNTKQINRLLVCSSI